MLSQRRGNRGVTLIELMVGVALVAVVLALAMPTFQTGANNRQIRAAADAVQNGLQVARTEALRRNRTVKFELRSPNGWTVGCDPTDTTIVDGEEVCPAVIQTREAQEGSMRAAIASVQTVASSGAVAPTTVFTGNLNFTPLGRIAAATLPPGNVANYRITNPLGGDCTPSGAMRCLSVVVTNAGLIRMCDPSVSAPDSRACY